MDTASFVLLMQDRPLPTSSLTTGFLDYHGDQVLDITRTGTIFIAILTASIWAGNSTAGEALVGDLLRIDASYNLQSTVLDDGFDEVTIIESSLIGTITYQSTSGLYGQLGLGRVSIEEVRVNNFTFDSNESYSIRGIGFGYRAPRAIGDGRYWGVGYSNTDTNEAGSDATHSFRLFWEKEWTNRYGIIAASYSTTEFLDLLSISGRHVWFGDSGVGIGVAWGLGGGRIDGFATDVDVGQAMLGGILMFRPGM